MRKKYLIVKTVDNSRLDLQERKEGQFAKTLNGTAAIAIRDQLWETESHVQNFIESCKCYPKN